MNSIFIKKWVAPFYLFILGGNYCSQLDAKERQRFIDDVRKTLPQLTPEVMNELIGGQWRYAITGSWFAGVMNSKEYLDQIGTRLLASETCYAGQSQAFAMACFCNDQSQEYLRRYLDEYLQQPESHYDQHWAMPALMWIDSQNKTNASGEYLKVGGLWESWAGDEAGRKIESYRESFWACMEFIREHFRYQECYQVVQPDAASCVA